MIVLGIETSCDETAAALVDGERRILAQALASQFEEHRAFGGVVPEIAARSHVERLDGLIAAAMAEAKLGWGALDAVAATAGPGLIGGVMVGLVEAKAIAAVAGLPFVAVNHLEGHALSVRLVEDVAFPYLLLLISGGHCQLLVVEGVGRYVRLGGTIDDAAGEAFDKTAKLLGLGYPGGPAVERAAATGDPKRFRLPRPMVGREGCDFSFSGLKTAVRQAVEGLTPGDGQAVADLAASFQQAVADVLADRVAAAAALFRAGWPEGRSLVVAGGVAANRVLRGRLLGAAEAGGLTLVAPPPALCTDNAAMIAWAGLERLRLGQNDPLDTPARARWPLDAAA
jgi:N6-L-threonylcarbamoyladenine synthase